MADDPLAAVLAEIREREKAATEGPWRVGRAHNDSPLVETTWPIPDGYLGSGAPVRITNSMLCTAGKFEEEKANAEFIAAARTDVPRLLAAVEAVLKDHQPGRFTVLGVLCKRHENHRDFSITATEAADVRDCPACLAGVDRSCTGCGPHVPVDRCPARTAIRTALLGEEASSG